MIRDQVLCAVHRKRYVTCCVRRIEGAVDQRTTGEQVLRPGKDHDSEAHIDASLESIQAAPLHQAAAELTEAERRLVVAKSEPQNHVQAGIREARASAVPMLQAEIHHAKEHEVEQIDVDEQRG